jgi:hypothetical protein
MGMMSTEVLLKLLATTIGVPPELVAEVKEAKFELDESEFYFEDAHTPYPYACGVTLIASKPNGEKLPFHLKFPWVVYVRLPLTIKERIVKVQI